MHILIGAGTTHAAADDDDGNDNFELVAFSELLKAVGLAKIEGIYA